MPFISQEELQERLKSPLNLRITPNIGTPNLPEVEDIIDPSDYPTPNIGHEEIINGKLDVRQIPIELRKTFSLLGKVNGEKPRDIAESFDISKNSVERSLSNHITNHEDAMKLSAFHEKIEKSIEDKRADASGKAVDALLTALEIIPPQIPGQSFNNQLRAAKTMADISSAMDKRDNGKEATVHFHIMTPPMKALKHYEVIDGEINE